MSHANNFVKSENVLRNYSKNISNIFMAYSVYCLR